MAKGLRTATVSSTGTILIPVGLAIGDQCVVAAWSDTASATLTSPGANGDSNTWATVAGGSEAGAASSTLYVFRCNSITSVPVSFTVAGATIAGMSAQAVDPGGETAGTPSDSTLASAVAAGAATITSNAVNASADSYTFIFYSADDSSAITTTPSGMTALTQPTVASGELAGYFIADANNAAYTNTLQWTTNGTERMAVAVSWPYTAGGGATWGPLLAQSNNRLVQG